jgi:hypothetical protein
MPAGCGIKPTTFPIPSNLLAITTKNTSKGCSLTAGGYMIWFRKEIQGASS